MDLFFNQGRCRVCGHMFCCRKHQLEHERVAHDEYADWIDALPALCRRCHHTVTNIHDLKGKCVQFNMKHTLLNEPINCHFGTPKTSNRKRIISINIRDTDEQPAVLDSNATLVKSRQKVIASRRLKKQMSPIVLIDLNEIKNRDDIINTVFSPQFNISQNILSGDAKSSTPLYEEKENLPVIAFFDKSDMSMYKTPHTIQSCSLVVVSALKKSTPCDEIIKDGNLKTTKKSSGRRVTFEMAKTPEFENLDVSTYATPEAQISPFGRRGSADERELTISFEKVENDENSRVEISIYGTLETENEPVIQSSHTESNRGRDCAVVIELVRSMKTAVTGIPKMIFNACGWSMRVIRKRKNDDASPMCPVKQKQSRRTGSLKRRPISSHWVNLSASSLRRRPLSAYQDIDDNSL